MTDKKLITVAIGGGLILLLALAIKGGGLGGGGGGSGNGYGGYGGDFGTPLSTPAAQPEIMGFNLPTDTQTTKKSVSTKTLPNGQVDIRTSTTGTDWSKMYYVGGQPTINTNPSLANSGAQAAAVSSLQSVAPTPAKKTTTTDFIKKGLGMGA